MDIPAPFQVCESLGSSFRNLVFPSIRLNKTFDPLHYSESLFDEERYVIGCSPNEQGRKILYVSLCVGATRDDEFKGWIHALLLEKCLDEGETWSRDLVQRCDAKTALDSFCRCTVLPD